MSKPLRVLNKRHSRDQEGQGANDSCLHRQKFLGTHFISLMFLQPIPRSLTTHSVPSPLNIRRGYRTKLSPCSDQPQTPCSPAASESTGHLLTQQQG